MTIETIEHQPQIAADRFVLRPLRTSDAGMLGFYAGDERVARMTSAIPHPMPPGAAEAFIARSLATDNPEVVWVLDGSEFGGAEVMGIISLKRMERGQCEIGYWIAPPYWNTGLASAAVNALIEANPLGCRTIFAKVFQDNAASARVLSNAGFQYLGDAETFSVARNMAVPTWTYTKTLG
ncbi:GNAT family N-acetyltransferase [Poseidonocella sedimentorum]|uniref:Protein N-acetyltransferase, RimJ/RimL family n=1 Tax=Poseidonocella sedimentorum TaxID=871652 RepID=A0A1I6EJ55_9RHOB|nr:GNAT family N-acetyltransferase [Poseidonocella sedimentorum]SFR17512.1 Protein N-acetyltransferase, RimJ/RimL family [Poseidonocella sedimentorum]